MPKFVKAKAMVQIKSKLMVYLLRENAPLVTSIFVTFK